jgi:hypothetical protein
MHCLLVVVISLTTVLIFCSYDVHTVLMTLRLRAHLARFERSILLNKAPCEMLYLYCVHTEGCIPLCAELINIL